MKKTTLGILAVSVLAVAGYGWNSSREQTIAVSVVKPEKGRIRATVSNTRAGTVNTCNRARISPVTGGKIAVLRVNTGDKVTAGQTLLEIWNEDTKAQLKLASVEKEVAIARAEEVCEASNVASREAGRFSKLLAEKMVSDERADIVVGEAKSTAAACRAMRKTIVASDARIAFAQAQLERTILRAPFAGTVAEINGEVGEIVTPSPVGVATLPAVDLIDDSCTYVSAPIDEVDAPRIVAGMAAQISLDAFGEQSFEGVVRRVAPYVLDLEKQARTVEIEVEFVENSDRLLPGYSADVEITVAQRDSVLKLPSQAVMDNTRVLVVDENNVLQMREITTGLRNWQETEVTAGVDQSDQVVLSVNRQGVVAGASVTIEEVQDVTD